MLKGLRFLAIFVGVVVDIGSSLFLGFLLGIALVSFDLVHGTAPKDLVAHINASLKTWPLLLGNLGLGGLGSLIGGFVAGWLAKSRELKNATVAGSVSILVSIPFWGKDPLWYDLAGCLFTIGPAMLGGYLAPLLLRRPSAPPA